MILVSQPNKSLDIQAMVRKITLGLLLIFTLTSCIESLVMGSGFAGFLHFREKTMEDTKDDNIISNKLGAYFLKNGLKKPFNNIEITVNEGRVLLTGVVRSLESKKLAVKLAWEEKRVKEVIDEIIVIDEKIKFRDAGQLAKDINITGQIEAKLLLNGKVKSINYKVNTVNQIVYILGVAQNRFEMNTVTKTAAKVRGVKKVINHVTLINDSRRH